MKDKKFKFHSEYIWNLIWSIWFLYCLWTHASEKDILIVGVFSITSAISVAIVKIQDYIDEKVTFEDTDEGNKS